MVNNLYLPEVVVFIRALLTLASYSLFSSFAFGNYLVLAWHSLFSLFEFGYYCFWHDIPYSRCLNSGTIAFGMTFLILVVWIRVLLLLAWHSLFSLFEFGYYCFLAWHSLFSSSFEFGNYCFWHDIPYPRRRLNSGTIAFGLTFLILVIWIRVLSIVASTCNTEAPCIFHNSQFQWFHSKHIHKRIN